MKKERVGEIIVRLARAYPKAAVSLDFTTPFELLIATILSAQSTDVRVNMVTKSLFRAYPDAERLAAADVPTLEREIKSTGFYRNKAKAIIGAAQAIVSKHGGEVPATMEELVDLPGVGRKTANVVLSNAFKTPVGVVVDTHVTRVSQRLALTSSDHADEVESDLMKLVPRKEWTKFSHRMILHGRTVCVARTPKCAVCVLNELCPSAREPRE